MSDTSEAPIWTGQKRAWKSTGNTLTVGLPSRIGGYGGWRVMYDDGTVGPPSRIGGHDGWRVAHDGGRESWLSEHTLREGTYPLIPDRKHGHYFRSVAHLQEIDVYRVLDLFGVTDQALGHAIKKLVVPGMRGGGKTTRKDIEEAIDTLQRRLQMMDEDDAVEPATQADPHAELRKTWAPGQKWQWCNSSGEWHHCKGDPGWVATFGYRRHPDDVKKPWYPDDSGKWVEYEHGKTLVPPSGLMVATLSKYERAGRKMGNASPSPAEEWDWPVIVAYKVVSRA